MKFFTAVKSFFLRLFRRKEIPLLENRVFFHYPKGHETDVEDDVYYSDSYFLHGAEVDDPSLATCSMGLAMASFSSNKLHDDLEFQAGNAVEFLQKCGFSDIETPRYFSDETRPEGIAFVMARKTLKQGKKHFQLIAIGVRGGNYGKEWASNMNIGLGDRHEGFSLAAKGLLLSFEDYLRRHKMKNEVRVWVSGFSRAAAVSNLFAQGMPKRFDKVFVSDVYAYCFACPNTTRVNSRVPSTTKNYLNTKDLLPLVPLPKWGYSRYGKDILLECPHPDDPFAAIRLDLIHIFSKTKRFRRETGVDKTAYVDQLISLLGERIGLNDFVLRFQEILEEFMSLVDPKLSNPYKALGDVVGDAARYAIEENGAFSLLKMIRSPKTDWETALKPAFEASLKDKPYPLNAEKIASALSDFFYLIREDVLSKRDFFLTVFDPTNLASVMSEHDPLVYLNALKRLDPKFGPTAKEE